MNRIIKLTRPESEDVYFSIDKIVGFWPASGPGVSATIETVSSTKKGYYDDVKETPEEIRKQIEKCT